MERAQRYSSMSNALRANPIKITSLVGLKDERI